MRILWAIAVLLAPLLVEGGGLAAFAEPVRVMTFNVRYGTAPDGENRWELRREFLLRVITEFDPDVLGVQEAVRDQIDEIGEALPAHGVVGVGREADGGGEYSAIFFRRARFDLMAADTFWLSDAPETPGSRTWGNTLPRICTWARLLDRRDSRRLTVFNTHWDHESQPSRVASGELMAGRIGQRVAAGDPVLVTGDFNSGPDNPAMIGLTQRGKLLRDTFRPADPGELVGTFHAFTGMAGPAKIDAVLATAEWQVVNAEIVRTEAKGRYPSDHFPVTAVVELTQETSVAGETGAESGSPGP
jgi:endonuclease/exonuclease/phosphatase family metal-dependent hydrolase